VHNIASIYDVFDYNSNANGMTYRNNLNINGVTINGQQDVLTPGDIVWEQISGTPGTISILHRRTTTFVAPTEVSFTSYYDDNSSRPASNCTGDGQAWGTSGIGVVFYDPNQCTDPRHPCGTNPSLYRTLQSRRTVYSDQSNGAASTASNYNNQFNNPLVITSSTCSGTSTNFTVSTSSNPAAGGTTSGGGTYTNGANVTVTATANSGYSFSNWTENGSVVSSSASYSFIISANRTLVANFTQSTTNYTVTTSSSPTAGGTTTGGGTYANGTNVTVTATANSGYSFSRWTENGTQVSTSASYSFTIGSNRNLVANFNQNQQYNCGVPTNLTATYITGTTAVIGWSFATAPTFRIRYRVVGTTSYTSK
ncbi:MAG: InlB B-repeat-containing protein, partial [Bacteroidota bacterium]